MTEEDLDTKVIFKMGYHMRIVVSMRIAIGMLALLSKEELLLCDSSYSTGKSVETLKPWGTDDVSISMITPAEILLRCAAGEKP